MFGYEGDAIRLILKDGPYFLLLISLSLIFTVIYFILLPSLPAGTINPGFVVFITPLQVLFAILFGLMLGLIITLNIYTTRSKIKTSKAIPTTAVVSTLVNVLCCTPLIPSVLIFLGASTPILFAYSPPIQLFFGQNYPYFYLLSFFIFFASFHYTSKNICYCKRG